MVEREFNGGGGLCAPLDKMGESMGGSPLDKMRGGVRIHLPGIGPPS